MERLTHSFKLLWRSERLLLENDLRQGAQKIQFNALAGLVALFGLVMLGIAFYFALVPHMGRALAALTVGGTDLVLAGVLIAFARSLKPAAEYDMVKEMRNSALGDIEEEVARAEADLATARANVLRFTRDPLQTIVPGAVGPLVSAVTRGVMSAKR